MVSNNITKIAGAKIIGACSSLVVAGLLLSGCFEKEAPKPEPKASIQQCAQIEKVVIEQGAANELNITSEQIVQELDPKLAELCAKLDQTYTGHISYESKLDQAVSTTKLTAKETKTATFSMNLTLKAESKTYTFGGKSMFEVSGKKVLDIGESVEIEPKDKQMLIDQAVQAVMNEANKVLKGNEAQGATETAGESDQASAAESNAQSGEQASQKAAE